MRQIKFRAWHTRDKDWCLSLTFGQENILGVSIGDIFGGDIIFEQFTGLNDKNGKEIYEGDILRYDRSGCFSAVEWCVSQWSQAVITPKGKRYYGMADRYDTIDCIDMKLDEHEIVGNIHENPNMLKVK